MSKKKKKKKQKVLRGNYPTLDSNLERARPIPICMESNKIFFWIKPVTMSVQTRMSLICTPNGLFGLNRRVFGRAVARLLTSFDFQSFAINR